MGQDMDPQTQVTGSERVVFRALVDERGVLLHLDTAAYHGLNPVGALIWTLLQPGTTFGRLVDELRTKVEDTSPGLEFDVASFLQDLHQRDLVVVSPPEDG